MKRIPRLLLILVFLFPSVTPAASVIYLKNGSRLTTPAWSREGDMILFQTSAGVMGIENREVLKIVSDDAATTLDAEPPRPAAPAVKGKEAIPPVAFPEGKTSATPPPATALKPEAEAVDLDAYKARKRELQGQLDAALARMRDSARRQDEPAKEEARREMRAISAQIYQLTDEVKRQNKGVLPADWWK